MSLGHIATLLITSLLFGKYHRKIKKNIIPHARCINVTAKIYVTIKVKKNACCNISAYLYASVTTFTCVNFWAKSLFFAKWTKFVHSHAQSATVTTQHCISTKIIIYVCCYVRISVISGVRMFMWKNSLDSVLICCYSIYCDGFNFIILRGKLNSTFS